MLQTLILSEFPDFLLFLTSTDRCPLFHSGHQSLGQKLRFRHHRWTTPKPFANAKWQIPTGFHKISHKRTKISYMYRLIIKNIFVHFVEIVPYIY